MYQRLEFCQYVLAWVGNLPNSCGAGFLVPAIMYFTYAGNAIIATSIKYYRGQYLTRAIWLQDVRHVVVLV